MQPLILAYAEEPALSNATGLDQLVYSPELNLTVVRTTQEPAIAVGYLGTETLTKTMFETSDTDRTAEPADYRQQLDTTTETRTRTEVSDTDAGYYPLRTLLDTATFTLVRQENSDSD
jgi:hypothetical protein